MGTEEGRKADSELSFYPSEKDIEKWMSCAFDMVRDEWCDVDFNL